jgi:hypothetical protein
MSFLFSAILKGLLSAKALPGRHSRLTMPIPILGAVGND